MCVFLGRVFSRWGVRAEEREFLLVIYALSLKVWKQLHSLTQSLNSGLELSFFLVSLGGKVSFTLFEVYF